MSGFTISINLDLPQLQPSKMKVVKNMAVEQRKGRINDQMIDSSAASGRDYLIHEVKKGEDWWDIGEQYDVDGTELQDFNAKFTPNTTLYEGREIKIPRHFVKKLSDTNSEEEE